MSTLREEYEEIIQRTLRVASTTCPDMYCVDGRGPAPAAIEQYEEQRKKADETFAAYDERGEHPPLEVLQQIATGITFPEPTQACRECGGSGLKPPEIWHSNVQGAVITFCVSAAVRARDDERFATMHEAIDLAWEFIMLGVNANPHPIEDQLKAWHELDASATEAYSRVPAPSVGPGPGSMTSEEIERMHAELERPQR